MIRQEDTPDSVLIGPYMYSIAPISPMKGTKFELVGACHDLNFEIEYQDDLKPAKTASVVLHEVLHAIFSVSDLRRDLKEDEEDIVCRLETQLCALIHNNPEFIAWVSQSLVNKNSQYVLEAVPVGASS